MNLQKKHYVLLCGWLLINLLQAAFTGLHSDESYYWMYSRNLDWGYFDHPPMAAFIIHAGYWLMQGELGVRLLFILLSTATLAFVLNELNEQHDFKFLSLFVLSFPLVHTHIAGFMAIPDIPLLFFTMVFLLLYKRFLAKPGPAVAVLMAAVLAAMIYSKYHAFIIIGFTVLSNLKLLRNKYFWLTCICTLLFLAPHIWWQFSNDFPTFRYHLVERAKPLRLKHITDYLLNQLIMAGPITGFLVLWKLSKVRLKGDFNRALIFNVVGFYSFLFLLSFKNRIEAHWTAAIIPMLMILTYPLLKHDERVKRWFIQIAFPVVVLMFLFRIYLAIDAIPNVGHTKITFYQRKASAMEIKNMANGMKVGFFNNYAATSNYIFYTGDSAVHLSTPGYRYCQYDLWNEEQFAAGEPVFAIQSKHMDPPNLTKMVTGEFKGNITIQEFQPLTGLEISEYNLVTKEDELYITVTLTNNTGRVIHTNHPSDPVLAIMQHDAEIVEMPLGQTGREVINPREQAKLTLTLSKTDIEPDTPFALYTRSKEDVRGELIAINPE